MKTKICGLNPTRDVQLCIDLKVNYLGFVFYKKSPRNIGLEDIRILKKYDRKDIRRQFIERYVPIKAMEDNSWCIYMRAPDVLPASFEGQSIWHTPPKLFVKSLRLQ